MTSLKTITRAAAALSLTLAAAGFAQAHGPASTSGSTDIYTTDFQKTFANAHAIGQAQAATAVAGSTDIWATDFQKTFGTHEATLATPATPERVVQTGSTDIYKNNFEMAFM
jgi:ABC-type phosphate transport system substrate-binding protein